MSDRLRLLLTQTTSTNTHAGNIAMMRDLAARAEAEGCEMLCLPEVAGLMERDGERARAQVREEAEDPFLAACRDEAAKRGLWVHSGSTPVLGLDGRFRNRSHLIDASGGIAAAYDKIHLFDVFLPDGEARLESKRFGPGERAVIVATPWGALGLTICYDLRFPRLYADLARAGARLIFAPSAFTRPTGLAHWEVLVRARAIETGAYLVAPAQCGRHDDGRETWGHGLAVDPWGEVLADLGAAPNALALELDLSVSETARERIPSLANARDYVPPALS